MLSAYRQLRALAAVLIALSGLAQTAQPWMAPLSNDSLLTALCGGLYLLLSLGLFGVGYLSLLLAMTLPALRACLGLWPLPVADAEIARMLIDLLVPLLCALVLIRDLRDRRRSDDSSSGASRS